MITVRRSEERGHFNHGWLDTYHTFSFAGYYDPQHMGFRDLRVINEDRVAPSEGFGEHGHRDMEIITYIIDGALAHKDSTGNQAVIKAGDLQRMSAGNGIRHSEFNASTDTPVHLLQIWILPNETGITPEYGELSLRDREPGLRLVASRDGRFDSMKIHQDVLLYHAGLAADQQVEVLIETGRHAWVQVAAGSIDLNGTRLEQGDGAAVSDEVALHLRALDDSAEALVFDLR